MKVVFTGSLSIPRTEAREIVIKEGGDVISTVGKGVDLVICGEKAGSKLTKAIKLGIKILSEEDFKKIIQ
jgi:NAD-dependent DNA ligase